MKRFEKVILGMLVLSNLAPASIKKLQKYALHELAIYKVDTFEDVKAIPTFSLGAPSGMVSRAEAGYFSLACLKDKDYTDGGMLIGMGYGDPTKIGGDISLTIGSVNPNDGGAFNRGSLNIAAGHNFRDQLLGVAVGIDSINLWHDSSIDYDENPSMYLAMTKLFPNDIAPMVFTVGAGNNNYAKINEEGDKKNHIYPFVSGAVYVMPQLSLVADYTSKVTTLGVGIVPFPRLPLTISLAAYDVTKEREEDKVSFIGTLSVAFHL